MTINGERQIFRRHALAIIHNANEAATTFLQNHFNAACTSIQRIFDEFFHGRSWTLHDLAGRNAVNQNGIEATDGHEMNHLF